MIEFPKNINYDKEPFISILRAITKKSSVSNYIPYSYKELPLDEYSVKIGVIIGNSNTLSYFKYDDYTIKKDMFELLSNAVRSERVKKIFPNHVNLPNA
jgi:intein-encoded DNA endonuclease-like protein